MHSSSIRIIAAGITCISLAGLSTAAPTPKWTAVHIESVPFQEEAPGQTVDAASLVKRVHPGTAWGWDTKQGPGGLRYGTNHWRPHPWGYGYPDLPDKYHAGYRLASEWGEITPGSTPDGGLQDAALREGGRGAGVPEGRLRGPEMDPEEGQVGDLRAGADNVEEGWRDTRDIEACAAQSDSIGPTELGDIQMADGGKASQGGPVDSAPQVEINVEEPAEVDVAFEAGVIEGAQETGAEDVSPTAPTSPYTPAWDTSIIDSEKEALVLAAVAGVAGVIGTDTKARFEANYPGHIV